MITSYNRPETLEDALELLAQPNTRPLGGGTWINQPHKEEFAVADLQALGLDHIHKHGDTLEIGATVSLQQLLENAHTPEPLLQAIRLEATLNIRNMATVAGVLVSCDGRSPFATVMLALDAKLHFATATGTETSAIGEFLPFRPEKLITAIHIPLNTRLAYESVARTPADRPIVCCALSQWPSGRARLALGGYGSSPLLAADGLNVDGLDAAARNAFHEAVDEWASAEYRMDIASTLAKRCLENINT
jgi:putative selenate reductase FAD-binding subunit